MMYGLASSARNEASSLAAGRARSARFGQEQAASALPSARLAARRVRIVRAARPSAQNPALGGPSVNNTHQLDDCSSSCSARPPGCRPELPEDPRAIGGRSARLASSCRDPAPARPSSKPAWRSPRPLPRRSATGRTVDLRQRQDPGVVPPASAHRMARPAPSSLPAGPTVGRTPAGDDEQGQVAEYYVGHRRRACQPGQRGSTLRDGDPCPLDHVERQIGARILPRASSATAPTSPRWSTNNRPPWTPAADGWKRGTEQRQRRFPHPQAAPSSAATWPRSVRVDLLEQRVRRCRACSPTLWSC